MLAISILGLAGTAALYLFLVKALPPLMQAEKVQRPLGWAHAISGTFILASLVVSWWSSWSIRYPVVFSLVMVGSGLLAGLRTKLFLTSGRTGYLSRAQFRLTPLLMPGLALWAAWSSADVVYHDADVSVEVADNTGMFSEITMTWVTLYQSRCLFFEERLGHCNTAFAPSFHEHVTSKEWWTNVSGVTVNTTTHQGVFHHYSGHLPFKYHPF